MSVSPEYLDSAQQALERVSDAFRPRLMESFGNISHTIKSDSTPVTTLDLEVETAIRKEFRKLDDSIGIVGEEHGEEGRSDKTWYIDPIDGTEQFIRGIPAFRIMATFVADGEIQYTYVNNVAKSEVYTARKDKGAYCNGNKLQVSDRPIERAWIEVIGNFELPELVTLIPVIRKATRGIRITGDFTHTPQGRFEGHLYYKAAGSLWDWTPWALLVREAGGKVANLGSDSYDYRNGSFLAAAPQVFDKLKPLIDEHFQGVVA